MITPRTLAVAAVLALAPAVVLSACSDDGASVRELDGSDGTSGSGSASASGSGAASGSASASGTAEVACEPVGDPADADSTVAVALDEWTVTPETSDLAAGAVALDADNVGEDAHELVVVRADSIADIPLDDEGAPDEEAIPADDFIGEVEPFPSGESCTGVFDLTPGDYVLFCAIVEEEDDGTVENHFQLGMRTEVSVS